MLVGENIQISKLNQIIARFRQNEGADIYALGNCSEFAVCLKRFVGGGTITKSGLAHTTLQYKNHYCDIYGCKKQSFGEYTRPARPSENAHIQRYLENGKNGKLPTTQKIMKGLRKAQQEVR